MRRATIALATALIAVLVPLTSPSGAAALPDKATWIQDVKKAMAGSQVYLSQRAAARKPAERLAVVLDIDNTSIATKYAWPEPVRTTLAFARYAEKKNITVFFVTGRAGKQLNGIGKVLTRAGYHYDSVCGRRTGERVANGKQRCRRAIAARGFTITANVGNRSTDFEGANYERAFRLPNYGNALS